MRTDGIAPPPEASAALIRALARGGGGSAEALSLLADLKASAGRRRGRREDTGEGGRGGGRNDAARLVGYNGAIEACAGAGEWQKAVSLLDEMRLVSVSTRFLIAFFVFFRVQGHEPVGSQMLFGGV